MKKNVLLLSLFGLGMVSCFKSKTCTCKDANNATISKVKSTSISKKALKSFEDDCKAKSTETTKNGATVSTPCEIS